ncbi:hypothetical protein N0V85_008648 [Neurospora sp. IMI 360204]|nr:hypothetical protein N0V85_008648 [Neurospora sp. IMI 360204]
MASHRPSQAAPVFDEQHREAVQSPIVPQQISSTESRDNQLELSWKNVQPDDYDFERDFALLVDDATTNFQELVGFQGMNQEFGERTGGYENTGDTLQAGTVDDEFTANNSAPANHFFDDSNHGMHSASNGEPAGNTTSKIDGVERQIDDMNNFDMNEPGFGDQDSGVTFGDADTEDDLFADHLFASYTADNLVGTGEKRNRGDREDSEDEAPDAQRSRQS